MAVSLRLQLAIFFVARTVVNTGFRMVYPFLPEMARGIGVSLEQVTMGITARSMLGLFSPFIGSAADSLGRKVAMILGLVVFVAAMLLVYLFPTYLALIAALVLTMAGKILFDPALYAYLGDHVHYQQRGLAVAVAEFSWSGGFLLGVPVVGWLIARDGWNAPFPWLALMTAGMILVIWRVVPTDAPRDHARPSLIRGITNIMSRRTALAGLSIGLLISTSNEVVNIIYGAWMENSFGLQVTALGAASAIIGIAELVGEGGVAGWVDRLGKRRAVGIGLIVYSVSCFLLPILASSLNGALVGLFLFYFTFEFTLVASLPLMTELVPDSRATFMAVNAAGHSLGRMIGSLIGPLLFASGLPINAGFAAIVNILALLVLWVFVRENHDSSH
jgi:MFS transporter, DHA1 family, inner membrane transport protein